MSQEKGPDPNCDICNGTGRYFDDDCYVRCPCTPTFPAPRIMPGQRGLTPEEGRERDRIKAKMLDRLQAILSHEGREEVELVKLEVLRRGPDSITYNIRRRRFPGRSACLAIGITVLLWIGFLYLMARKFFL
jgi:hypothetical protein